MEGRKIYTEPSIEKNEQDKVKAESSLQTIIQELQTGIAELEERIPRFEAYQATLLAMPESERTPQQVQDLKDLPGLLEKSKSFEIELREALDKLRKRNAEQIAALLVDIPNSPMQ